MVNQKKINALVKIMIELTERNYTESVLMPLFRTMNYQVDYFGGPNEGGKDLICWRDDDFGEKELTVIQIKKTKLSAAASAKNSFSEIITQLSQAIEKKVPDLDGSSRTPDKVIFITPFEINARELESRIEGYASLKGRGVKVYDGRSIAKQLIKRDLSIVSDLLGKEHDFGASPTAGFSNRDLLNALNYGKDINLRHFYTDLDFGLGKIRTGTFLEIGFSPTSICHELNETKWKSFQSNTVNIESFYKKGFTNPPLAKIESDFQQRFNEWTNDKNQKVIEEINTAIEEIRELMYGLDFAIPQISPEISLRQKGNAEGTYDLDTVAEQSIQDATPSFVNNAAASIQNITNHSHEIDNYISEDNENHLDKNIVKKLKELINAIRSETNSIEIFVNKVGSKSLKPIYESIETNLIKLNLNGNKLKKLINIRIAEPKYQVEINGYLLAEILKKEQRNLRLMIKKLNNEDPRNSAAIKSFF